MLNSKEQLMTQAKSNGYKPEIFEKVFKLLDVFQQIMAIPFLQERLVLIVSPELITNDSELAKKMISHPAINWVIKKR